MKLGIVFEGGASRAYFSCGVMDGLLDAQIMADYVIGTSAGIANAVSYVSRQKGRNLRIAQDYLHDKRYMGFRHLLSPTNRSYYNMDFVFDTIPNKLLPFDFETFAQFKGEVVASVTNVRTGQAEFLKISPDDRKMMALRASCALPLLFPIIKIGDQAYMDGGIAAPIPVDQAIRAGCDKILVVLTRERGYQKQVEKTMELARRIYRRYPKFVEALHRRADIYNENLRRLEELEAQELVFIIAPDSMHGIHRTEADALILEELYHQGYLHMQANLAALKAFLQPSSGECTTHDAKHLEVRG
ncbi:MAG: patatin family protein [Eubacteriales bacterium]|nr:patatin family protein [Eubacteriales bacterium]